MHTMTASTLLHRYFTARPPRKFWEAFAVAVILVCLDAPASANGGLTSAVQEALQNRSLALTTTHTREFYTLRHGEPAWRDDNGWKDHALSALDVLRNADIEGLRPSDYPATQMTLENEPADPEAIAMQDVLLTDSVLSFIRHLRIGRVAPADVESDIHMAPPSFDSISALNAGLESNDFPAWIASLTPANKEYTRLKKALADYRKTVSTGVWPILPEGKKFEPGSTGPRVRILRRQLVLHGLLTADLFGGADFDEDVVAAVKAFQERLGLDPDGIVGPITRQALNVSNQNRILQIELNMERARWLSPEKHERYVYVNLANFKLTAYANDVPVLESAIIIGRDARKTPVFSDRIVNLVLAPTWTVTPRIARLDLLPKLQNDPGYLKTKGIRVFSDWSADAVEVDQTTIDWANMRPNAIPFKFRQDPGPLNALGGVRFSLTNDFFIYLHDTPDRNLFHKSRRSFSSGCIRVKEVLALAMFALNGDANWPVDRVQTAMEAPESRIVKLSNPLPVLITYSTAWVDDSGLLQFRDDVYGRDKRLSQKLGLSSQ
ncbi:MAG: L,D-transpeptidase family protein [Alphaproteobacteria bacterium]